MSYKNNNQEYEEMGDQQYAEDQHDDGQRQGDNEFEGYDQAMFQQQDQPFYAEDLRQKEQSNSKMRYF